VDQETGETLTCRLEHEKGEAGAFYASLPPGAVVGIEATFPALWFERPLAECHLTRRLFGSMVRRIELLPLPAR
jgi:hypothetical protein